MLLQYLLYALISLAGDILAVVLAPVAAIFYRTKGGREYLLPMWQWITTHDAPADTYTFARGFAKDQHFILGRYTYDEIQGSWWLRYVSRIVWIWRNPAYQLDHWMGYDQNGVVVTKHRDDDYLWDTGVPNCSYWTAVNAKGQRAFLYERQIFYWGSRCLELQFGWKLYRNDPDKVCMLALRITPFKSYPG